MQVSARLRSNTRRPAAPYLCLLAKWHHNQGPVEVKVNQGSERTGRAGGGGGGGMRPVSPAHTCEAPAERWQRALGQITSDSSFQMPLVKVSIYMSNLRLPAWALVDYSLPSLKSLAHLGWLLLLNWNVPLEYSSPHSKKAALHFDLWPLRGSSVAEAVFCVMYQRLDVDYKRNNLSPFRFYYTSFATSLLEYSHNHRYNMYYVICLKTTRPSLYSQYLVELCSYIIISQNP